MSGRMYEIAFNIAARMGSNFNKAFSSASDRLTQLNTRVSGLKAEMKELDAQHRTGKISVLEYSAAYEKLTAQMYKAEQRQKSYARAYALQNKVEQSRSAARMNMIGAAETAMTLAVPIRSAMRFEDKMADVRKVVDFDTPEQYKEMGNDILLLSRRIPMAAEGLAAIVAAGGQAGFDRGELLSFAEDAAKMGVAFDVTADEAGQMMAGWRSAFKMNQADVVVLADKINYLGNTTAASAPKISEVVTRIGSLGEVAGINAGQIAAMGATLTGMNIPSEIASTGIKNFLLALNASEGATNKQAEAFSQLGLDVAEMAKVMQTDAEKGIMTILERLKELPEYSRAAVMTDLFGKESLAAIAPLLTQTDVLRENLAKVADATKYAGSMQKEFEARSATTSNSLQLLANNMTVLAVTVGDKLLPHINNLSKRLSGAAEWVDAVSKKYPVLTEYLVVGTAAVLGGTVALSAMAWAGWAVITPFVNLYAWTKKIELATKLSTAAQWAWNVASKAGRAMMVAWTAAQWAWNAAMTANPIGLLVVGIAGLVAAGYYLIKNWDTVKEWWTLLWNDPMAALQSFIDGIYSRFGKAIDWLGEKWAWVKNLFTGGATAAGASVSMSFPAYAAGTIATKPHVGLFAEKGPEALIPLDGSQRALSLWATAGRMLGLGDGPSLFQDFVDSPSGSNGDNYSFVFSPSVTVSGDDPAVENKVRRAIREEAEDFERRMEAWVEQQRRLSYG